MWGTYVEEFKLFSNAAEPLAVLSGLTSVAATNKD